MRPLQGATEKNDGLSIRRNGGLRSRVAQLLRSRLAEDGDSPKAQFGNGSTASQQELTAVRKPTDFPNLRRREIGREQDGTRLSRINGAHQQTAESEICEVFAIGRNRRSGDP